MKIETVITLTQAELEQCVAKALFLPALASVTLKIDSSAQSTQTPSTAPIGKTMPDGTKITHYGYPGDSTPDSYSMKGIGDRNNKLVPNVSAALTKSARTKFFGSSGKSTGKKFPLVFEGVNWELQDDDTAPQDEQRIDIYDPYYEGMDSGCSPTMFAKSKAQMVEAGILSA